MTEYQTNWRKYEEFCVQYHSEKYGHKTWWWNYIPEEELFKSNILPDTKKLRLLRKSNREQGKPIQEYGLDGLALDDYGNYHGLQMKYWNPNSYLTAEHLGTFLLVLQRMYLLNNTSNGYLYYTCKLQRDFREIIDDIPYFIHEKLKMNIEEEKEEIKLDETLLEPYPCQLEALECLENHEWNCNMGILSMPCGIGKTFVLSKYLQLHNHNKIIILSPLKIQVSQMFDRVYPFIHEHYETLIIDSDTNGTTDIYIINDFIERNDNFIIFITFKSAIELLDIQDDWFIVIDEAHNLVENDFLQDYTNDMLLVSATPPNKLLCELGGELIYEYTLQQAIENDYVCDYNINLPLKIDDNIIVDIPEDITIGNIDLASKCLFLLSGMLEKGSRRCIVYCTSIEECEFFNTEFQNISNEYHYLNVQTYTISSEVRYRERQYIIDDFQRGEDDIKIITSVRILDEGINIPVCDSIFITNLSDTTSEIKTIQRMCRSNRKDRNNPNKKSNCFIWSDDNNQLVSALSYLKEEDSNFIDKISMISSNYEDKNTSENIEIKNMNKEIELNFIRTKCLTFEELFSDKLRMVSNFIDEYERRPQPNGCLEDKYEKYLCGWLGGRIKQYNKNTMLNCLRIEFDEFLNKYNEYFKSNEEIWNDNKQLLFEFIELNGRCPKNNEIFRDKRLGIWWANQKKRIDNTDNEIYKILSCNTIIEQQLNIFLSKTGYTKIPYNKGIRLLHEYTNITNQIPPPYEVYNNINIGQLYRKYKQQIDNKMCKEYISLSTNNIMRDNLDKYLLRKEINKQKKRLSEDEWIELIFKYIQEFNKVPKSNCIYQEQKIGVKILTFKSKIKSIEDSIYIKLSANNSMKENLDNYLFPLNCWNEKKEILFEYIETYNKIPVRNTIYKNQKIGCWFHTQLSLIRNSKIEPIKLKLLQENIIVNNAIEHFIIPNKKWESNCQLLFEYIEINNKLPKNQNCIYENLNIYYWWHDQKSKIKSNTDIKYLKLSENEIVKRELDKYLLKKQQRK